ncbi:autotransporter outer membrane beta-barrel domain-containing protein [Sphingomonas sp. RIT328]|uniref:autotransporter outer membrane beta-barrel domain-containing protein n=1 Tax=Sphingomonas sp. RIT328 TaxID=1470591 RepID=UPI001F2728B5|nr:autotransporter outer membrane beta-barrel domain-containing protein [Sphingomonas sp. RIT328]
MTSTRRVRVRALQTSGMALAMVAAAPAFAQCAPDPTQTNTATNCTGTDSDGLVVTTYGTTVNVPAGATVQGGSRPGIAVALPSTSYGSAVSVAVAGTVDGGTQPGVSLLWQPAATGYGYYDARLDLTVAQGGSVTGSNAVVIGRSTSTGYGYGSPVATIDNSGTLTGTSGIALLATTPGYGSFAITNRATGTIGAISGAVSTLDNAGTIDGGTRSAIDWGYGYATYRTLANSGTITAASSAATLANLPSNATLANSGTIANTGSGAAIAGTSLSITNAATGRITAGATAISADNYLTLTNAGTINGNIVTAVQAFVPAPSTIDSRAGTINGSVTFGASSDTLIAGWNNGLVTGITGVIDGGGGTDTVQVRFAGDTTLARVIALPTNFEQLSLAPETEITTTLADGFAAPGLLEITGKGTVVNRTTLSGAGKVVRVGDYDPDNRPSFVNAGAITATGGTATDYAIDLRPYATRFENSGTITAAANGVSAQSSGSFVNTATGTITATDTGVSVDSTNFTNAGTIRSTAGTGLLLSGYASDALTNRGLIEGKIAGALINTRLVNTGTITSPGTGVLVGYSGTLDNRTGGTINGGVAGVETGLWQATIANAGTINGDVRLVGGIYSSSYSANRFFALAGGVVNGNLTLGTNDVLVTEFAGSGGGRIAGITGTVTATNSTLRYRVRSDTATSLTTLPGFAGIGYDLYDGATLTLTGGATQVSGSIAPLTLAGEGVVDLNATIASTSQPAIQVTSLLVAPGETQPAARGLVITSRGALTLDRPAASSYSYPYTAIALTNDDTFTNAGTIIVRDRATPNYSIIAAISGGKSVVNSGTITLDNAIGISGALSITNSGAIIRAAGGGTAIGISDVTDLTNSGSIDVAGTAVMLAGYNGGTITNTGRIASSSGAAIGLSFSGYSYGVTVSNLAGGTIAGGAGTAIRMAGGTIRNAGTITGSVDLGYSSYGGVSSLPATYIAEGGTLTGDLRFGSGDDQLVAIDDVIGVSGTVDGGGGIDTFVHARTASGSIALGTMPASLINFEREGVRAIGTDTTVTITAADPVTTAVLVSGDGSIINTATILGGVSSGTSSSYYTAPQAPLAAFTNSGTLGSATLAGPALRLYDVLAVTNTGTLINIGGTAALSLSASGSAKIANSGTITGGVTADHYTPYTSSPADTPAPSTLAMTNSGTITAPHNAVFLSSYGGSAGATVSLDNSGTIAATADGGTAVALYVEDYNTAAAPRTAVTLTNSGTIRANGGGTPLPADPYAGAAPVYGSAPALAVHSYTTLTNRTQITNTAAGTIEATGTLSTAIFSEGGLDLTNAGTIRGSNGTALARNDYLSYYLGSDRLAGAIQTVGDADNRIVNTGTIIGSIALGGGNDRIENRGTLTGDVFLGAGDDIFLQQANATLTGTVDGGDGTDMLIVDATGGGTINAAQFVRFEGLSQTGQGNVNYLGSFGFDTIGLAGGTITVAAGDTLATSGPVALTGSSGDETVINNGTILGAVALGAGNDTFVEGPNSRVTGIVDGGAGDDLYSVVLAGDRSGIGARTGFERLAVGGTGTLRLTLDQDFTSLALNGASADLTLAGYRITGVTGSDAAETLRVDGDIARVALGGGDDTLALGTSVAMGRYDGGSGTDTLAFTTAAPVTLVGSATGFERVALTGSALTVAGTLGSAAAPLAFTTADTQLTVADGGTLAGVIDLGTGNTRFRLAAGGTLVGSVAGGGQGSATVALAGDRTLTDALTGFATLTTEGSGTLSLAGTYAFDRVGGTGNLAVLANAALTTGQLRFGDDDNRLTIAGRFAGSVDGGAGRNTIAISGGNAAAPVAFGSIAQVAALSMSDGFATVSGNAALGTVDMSGGRLVGLAGSTLSADQFLIRPGATFGSAGTVNGNVNVAGILSPGASPGTMTVNGNVALQSGSVSLFEITPTVSDKLVVNGTVTIAPGATLQLAPSGTLRPGTSYDLITASGGITGSYATILKPDSLFGFVVQRGDRLQLLGQFLDPAGTNAQISRSIAYANRAIVAQPADSALFAALPALLTANGTSDAAAFARLTPETYASASQIGVDNALALAATARGPGLATDSEDVRLFTFAQMLGGWHRLGADAAAGTAATRSQSYGFLGGIGIGDATWSVGAFAGYLNDRQQIDALAARTKLNGAVAGVEARYAVPGGLGVTAAILYDGGTAHSTRALPGAGSASASYGLHSWVSDLSLSYDLGLSTDWTLRPRAGLTLVRTTRAALTETGSVFALSVARDRHVAGFADAGLTFARSDASKAPLRPFVSLGLRYQFKGNRTEALGGYAGGGLGLTALGAARADLVGTAAAGLAYRLTTRLDLFSTVSSQTGRDDHQESISTGVRLRF